MKRPRGKIYLDENNIESLIRSAIETYPKETIGSVFGTFEKKENSLLWRVSGVHAIQSATRRENEAIMHVNVVNESWSLINSYIGSYHSHPYDFDKKERLTRKLSKEDRELHPKSSTEVEIIVNVYKVPRRFRLTEDKRIICGNIPLEGGGYYRIDIIGYSWIDGQILKTEMQTTPKFYQEIKKLNS